MTDSITTILGITVVDLKDKLSFPINKLVHSKTYNRCHMLCHHKALKQAIQHNHFYKLNWFFSLNRDVSLCFIIFNFPFAHNLCWT